MARVVWLNLGHSPSWRSHGARSWFNAAATWYRPLVQACRLCGKRSCANRASGLASGDPLGCPLPELRYRFWMVNCRMVSAS